MQNLEALGKLASGIEDASLANTIAENFISGLSTMKTCYETMTNQKTLAEKTGKCFSRFSEVVLAQLFRILQATKQENVATFLSTFLSSTFKSFKFIYSGCLSLPYLQTSCLKSIAAASAEISPLNEKQIKGLLSSVVACFQHEEASIDIKVKKSW